MNAPVWPAGEGSPALFAGDRVHLVGIGGAGMSGLARVLAAKGVVVSGSDRSASKTTKDLEALGIAVTIGHGANRLEPGTKLVVYTPAVAADNPEVVAARERGIPLAKRFDLLAPLIDTADSVAVAGTHGKTTTSGLIAWLLTEAGDDPSYFVGGDVVNLGANAAGGRGRRLVIEADEYDRSFLHGHPLVAVITNVEHDHPDIYPTLEDVTAAFTEFAARLRPDGRLVACADSPGALRVAAQASASLDLYYVKPGPGHGSGLRPASTAESDLDVHDGSGHPPGADRWWADDVVLSAGGSSFQAWHLAVDAGTPRSVGRFELGLAGRHNVANALAALVVAERFGLPHAIVARALSTYRGAERRFQVLGAWQGLTVIDDYAHHPTEITATLQAARARFPGGVLWVVIEPHTYSRVATLRQGFAASARAADRVYFAPIYAAREAPLPGLTSATLAAAVPGAKAAESLEQLVDLLAADLSTAAPRPTALLFLGAGDIIQASADFVHRLERLAIAELRQSASDRGLGGDARPLQPIASFTSLRVGGPASLAVTVKALSDLAGWWRLARERGVPCRVLGRGSNVLAADDGFQGLVIVNRCESWSLSTASASEAASASSEATDGAAADIAPLATVIAESGVTLASLAQALAKDGWRGFEAGVGIPGSVGAGVVTNAGAHGWDMAASTVWAEVMDASGVIRRLSAADLAFDYRRSALKGEASHVVLRVALRVRRDDPAAIQARIRDYQERRRAGQPNTPSVGSMFKNPPGDFAGRLIEAAGLKGARRGGAEISTKHANFFVNLGRARAADVASLVVLARAAVERASGVRLELEIETLGDMPRLAEAVHAD